MKKVLLFKFIMLLFLSSITVSFSPISAQDNRRELKSVLEKAEKLRIDNSPEKAIALLEKAEKTYKNNLENLAFVHAFKCRVYVYEDSLIQAKRESDLSLEYSYKTKDKAAKSVALFSKAYINNAVENRDVAIKSSQDGLSLLENNDAESELKSLHYYMLYSAYSNWNNIEKMKSNAENCAKFAIQSNQKNLLANAYNAISSTFQVEYSKENNRKLIDSSWIYLQKSWEISQDFPNQIPNSTTIITATNIASFILNFESEKNPNSFQKANQYLLEAEKIIRKTEGETSKLANIYGIRSAFAMQENNLEQAKNYLKEGLSILKENDSNDFDMFYNFYKSFAMLYEKEGNDKLALEYTKKAEEMLLKIFDKQQIFNAQKLEIQYETEKKNEQLKLLQETVSLKKRQNYLWIGIALASILGLGFMFRSYHFKLRYSLEREKKITREKEEAERNAEIQMKLKKEEQARLNAESELLKLKQQQLQKEAMTNALQIERKNETLQQIKSKILEGNPQSIQNLLKEETFVDSDFEEVKSRIQKIHPNFFAILNEKSEKKLTALDLKYCSYLHLRMSSKQIAKLLHVEVQSVRMFKYRLKQKLGLSKNEDLDVFLQEIKG